MLALEHCLLTNALALSVCAKVAGRNPTTKAVPAPGLEMAMKRELTLTPALGMMTTRMGTMALEMKVVLEMETMVAEAKMTKPVAMATTTTVKRVTKLEVPKTTMKQGAKVKGTLIAKAAVMVLAPKAGTMGAAQEVAMILRTTMQAANLAMGKTVNVLTATASEESGMISLRQTNNDTLKQPGYSTTTALFDGCAPCTPALPVKVMVIPTFSPSIAAS